MGSPANLNAPGPAHVRTRLRESGTYSARFVAGHPCPASRLFFNSLLNDRGSSARIRSDSKRVNGCSFAGTPDPIRDSSESNMPKLYSHPFSSYCQKVLIALYESETPFEYRMLASNDAQAMAELEALWRSSTSPRSWTMAAR